MLIDGRTIAKSIGEDLREKIQKLGRKLTLAVFLVGDDPGSLSFIAQKEKFGTAIGVNVEIFRLPENIGTDELKQRIRSVGGEARINGIIVQLPLPKTPEGKTQEILDATPYQKDPDCLTSIQQGLFLTGRSKILPPAVGSLARALETYRIKFKKGDVAVLIGQGNLIGKPLAEYLIQKEFTVLSVNDKTKNLAKLTKIADVVISGAGVPKLIKAKLVRRGATVIDFGFSQVRGKIVGDVDTEKVAKAAKYVSPVPGGMGPITVAMLFRNLIDLQR